MIGHKPSPFYAEHFGISHVMIGCAVSEIARETIFALEFYSIVDRYKAKVTKNKDCDC